MHAAFAFSSIAASSARHLHVAYSLVEAARSIGHMSRVKKINHPVSPVKHLRQQRVQRRVLNALNDGITHGLVVAGNTSKRGGIEFRFRNPQHCDAMLG